MNWIERMYELKGKDIYSQNGEGYYLEYVFNCINSFDDTFVDLGAGDGFYLSNSKHLVNIGWKGIRLDKINNNFITCENVLQYVTNYYNLICIDLDGNDYWILETVFKNRNPKVVIAEFNAAFSDSRTIKYDPDFVWVGDDYFGFSFEAGKKLAHKHGYEVVFQIANMNLIMVRKDLIDGLHVPPVTFQVTNSFKVSGRTDWIMI